MTTIDTSEHPQVIANRILTLSGIRNFIGVMDSTNISVYTYDNDNKKLSHKYFTHVIPEVFATSAQINKTNIDFMESIVKVGYIEAINDVLIGETVLHIYREFMRHINKISKIKKYTIKDKIYKNIHDILKIFNKRRANFKKIIKIKDVNHLLSVIKEEIYEIEKINKYDHGYFLICGANTIRLLQQHFAFETVTTDTNNDIFSRMPQFIGKIYDISIYHDPNMISANDTVYIGAKTTKNTYGTKLFILPKSTYFTTTDIDEMFQRKTLNINYAFVDIGDDCEQLYRKFHYQYKPKK